MTEKELLQAAIELKQIQARWEAIAGVKMKHGDADKVIAAAKAGHKWVKL